MNGIDEGGGAAEEEEEKEEEERPRQTAKNLPVLAPCTRCIGATFLNLI